MYDNLITSDHLEQVVQKIQNTKASKSTTLSGYGITDSYTKTETDNRIQDIVGAAPEALDTLEEIAEALQDGESTVAGIVQTLSQKADKSTTVTNIAYGSKKLTKTINGSTTDVVTINAIKSDLALTKSDVGLSNVDNTSDANKPVSNATQTALDTKVDKVSGKGLSTNDYTTTEKNKLSGIASNAQVNIIESIKVNNSVLPISSKAVNITVPTKTSELTNNSNFAVDSNYVHTDNNYTTAEKQKLASKVAELDSNGKVLSSQLPSYVDDVLEYISLANFPTTGESGKIYVDTGANLTYRWTGSTYTEISPSLALGETSSTAYRGDRGKVAYTHATDSNRLTTAKTSGLYKISTTAEGHVASAETATKSDIGLGNVDNTSDLDKPISTATQEALNTKVNVTTSVLKSDEEFTYRQTGDGSLDIDAKYGKLKSIKGRTLVWNQLVQIEGISNSSVSERDYSVLTEAKYVEVADGYNTTRTIVWVLDEDIPTGHTILIRLTMKSDYEFAPYLRIQSGDGAYSSLLITDDYVPNEWRTYNIITTVGLRGIGINPYGSEHIVNKYISTPLNGGLNVFDLTLMFGVGKEPTVDEFTALYPESSYAYCPGKLINNGKQEEYDVVWNQLYNGTGTISSNGIICTKLSDNTYSINGTATAAVNILTNTGVQFIAGHKYYGYQKLISGSFQTIGSMFQVLCDQTLTLNSNMYSGVVQQVSTDTGNLRLHISLGDIYTDAVMSFGLVDLTVMFGLGKEPTAAEFEEMFPDFRPTYGTRTQQHVSFPQFKTKIETVGWNIWDEEWENCSWSAEGVKASNLSCIGSSNRIPVLSDTMYYFRLGTVPKLIVTFFLSDGSLSRYPSWVTGLHRTPVGAVSMVFNTYAADVVTMYSHDICISLSDPSRNGTYEPYWRSDLKLGLGDIKVKSHNLWDEVWEAGSISTTTGQDAASDSYVRTKNYVPILGSTYVFSGVLVFPRYYDENYQYLNNGSSIRSGLISPPAGTAYARFVITGSTYDDSNKTCINFSDPAFNGRYEPYGDGGVISITEGLKSAGTVYDEISGGKFIKRIGAVDMGSLTWNRESTYGRFLAPVDGIRPGISNSVPSNIVCAKYKLIDLSTMLANQPDKTLAGTATNINVCILDSAYSDAATFKASLSGVPLYYELAQPIEYELYSLIDLSYKVDKFGTEKLLPESTSAIVSSPFRADIEYRTTNVTIDDVYGGSDIIKSVEDVDSRLTTVEKSINGLVTIGSGSPTTIPKNIGDFYIDVTNKVLYFATGNQLISDWNS